MTSRRKTAANRRNARASTGPRTAAGKGRAAQNARKHGLAVPALRDPAKAQNIGELARKLAGPTADAQRFEAACRLVAAQIDLLAIREARLPLLARALTDRSAIKRLHSIDRYERYARSQRSRAVRELGSAHPPLCRVGLETRPYGSDATLDNTIDLAAVLGMPALGRRRGGFATRPYGPRLGRQSQLRTMVTNPRLSRRENTTGFAILPKRSQPGKPSKTNVPR